jgi:murein DD-endopeptidase MepM/ murein hydrolase activator NlpD
MKTKLFVLITVIIMLFSGCTSRSIDEDNIKEAANAILNSSYVKPILELAYPAPKLTLQNENSVIQYGVNGSLVHDSLGNSTLIHKIAYPYSKKDMEIDSKTDLTTLKFNCPPDRIIERIYKDNKLIKVADITNDTLSMPSHEGLYRIELDCLWTKEDSENMEGKAIYDFEIYYNMPSKFTISSNCVKPGEVVIVHAENIKDSSSISLNTNLFDDEVLFYPEEGGYFGIIPIEGALAPMDYIITIECSEDNIKLEDTVTVPERKYPIQNLQVSSETLSLRSQENIEKNGEDLKSSRDINNSSKTKLWSEPFIEPVKGVITTEYYEIRYTNGNPIPRYHTGIDIAAPYNTPILAANSGKVVLAKEMILTGNTLVIDHGCGLYSTYCHLNSMNFKAGQNIYRGEVLGLMGSTGFSTGSHLHFEMCYNGICLDPEFFYDKDFNYDRL